MNMIMLTLDLTGSLSKDFITRFSLDQAIDKFKFEMYSLSDIFDLFPS